MKAKPVKAGGRLSWSHYSAPGDGWLAPFGRSGTVWSEAPVGNGLVNAWWVFPDQVLDGEALAGGALCVGKAAGAWRSWVANDDGPAKGEVYSSGNWRHQPAALTASAAAVQRELAAACGQRPASSAEA